jgi:outer membrane protein assembly factor BamA
VDGDVLAAALARCAATRCVTVVSAGTWPAITPGLCEALAARVRAGVAVRFGVPFSEFDTVFMGLGWERTELGTSVGLPLAWLNYRALYGNNADSVTATVGWARDGRDSLLVPSTGRYQRVLFEYSFTGEVRYLKTNLQYQEYWSLPYRLTLGVNAEVGIGTQQQQSSP